MTTQDTEDRSTEAELYLEEARFQTQSRSTVLFKTIKNTVAFSYSHDVLTLGDPFSVAVPDPRGEFSGAFARGSSVRLKLKNPNVNGGQPTLKHLGLVVRRKVAGSVRQGTAIQLDCADLGWHLENNDAPLWYKLRYGTMEKLLTDDRFISPSWGLQGLETDQEVANLLRRGKPLGRAGATLELAANAFVPIQLIQVEPGDKVADIIVTYCKRYNLLVNVTPGGKIQIWRPNYNKTPLYSIELHGLDDPDKNRNGVLEYHIEESCEGIYSEVNCVGEMIQTQLGSVDPKDPNGSKRRGTFRDPDFLLPFTHRLNFANSEVWDSESAKKDAKWRYERSIFDSWTCRYIVRGHHQNGEWYESDQMIDVNDSINGNFGAFYIQSVRCDRTEQGGDRTELTLRKPGLLQASFGVHARAPRIKVSPPSTATATESGNVTTVERSQ